MGFQVKPIAAFRRNIRQLSKKYRSLPGDVNALVQELRLASQLGTPIGHGCYKIRLAIASKGAARASAAGPASSPTCK